MTEKDIWQPLSEQRWKELAEGTGASELQIKFAAARFGGATATAAARLAGYSGDKDSLRRAGYSALRSTAVQALLELAAINAPADAKISAKEIDAKLARLIRSGDPNVVLKAAELHQKREALKKAEHGGADDDDSPELLHARIAVRQLTRPFGASCFMLWFAGAQGSLGHPANFPLLHDVYFLAMKEEPFGKQIWDWACSGLSDVMLAALNEHLADPNWQLAERIKVWGEANQKPPGPIPGNPLLTLGSKWGVAKSS